MFILLSSQNYSLRIFVENIRWEYSLRINAKRLILVFQYFKQDVGSSCFHFTLSTIRLCNWSQTFQCIYIYINIYIHIYTLTYIYIYIPFCMSAATTCMLYLRRSNNNVYEIFKSRNEPNIPHCIMIFQLIDGTNLLFLSWTFTTSWQHGVKYTNNKIN